MELLNKSSDSIGRTIYDFATELFPLNRSLTGDGVRETLNKIQSRFPELVIHEVSSGTKAFDWEKSQEWLIREAYFEDELGNKHSQFSKNNLHVLGFSEEINRRVSYEELDKHLFSSGTTGCDSLCNSYYKNNWGFCLPDSQRKQ